MARNVWTLVLHVLTIGLLGWDAGQQVARAQQQPSGAVMSYCRWEAFNASCPDGSVIVTSLAHYGRMRTGRCMSGDYKIGCFADVIQEVDERCSGRQRCEIPVPDKMLHEIQPCPKDLGAYLEASYDCVPVQTAGSHICHSYKPLYTDAPSGFLSSLVTMETRYGGSRCPWRIRADKGQRINITLYDFGTIKNQGEDATFCPVYAHIKEAGDIREVPICGGQERMRRAFTSIGNDVEVTLTSPAGLDVERHFLFKYTAVGCTTPIAPPGGWVRREGETLTIGCNKTTQKWHLVCKDTHWVGKFMNCTPDGDTWQLGQVFDGDTEFPFGLIVSIIIGVVLGVIIGSALLGVVLACRRRRRRAAREHGLLEPTLTRPYGPWGHGDSGYGGSSLQKGWAPGAHGAQGSPYAHIWELKQSVPEGGVPAADGRPGGQQCQAEVGKESAAVPLRQAHQKNKEHIYESPKFERRDSAESYRGAFPLPHYHEFDQGPGGAGPGEGLMDPSNCVTLAIRPPPGGVAVRGVPREPPTLLLPPQHNNPESL